MAKAERHKLKAKDNRRTTSEIKMIGVAIFYLHIIAIVAVFTRNWQRGGMGEGFLGTAFFALIFSVGWTFSSFLLSVIIPPEGFATWFDRNTMSLIVLTAMEYLMYKLYFWDYLFKGEKQKATV